MHVESSPVRFARTLLILFTLALGLGACATLGFGGGRNATLVVINDLEEQHTLQIFLNPAVGPRRLIGTVPPGATTSLRFTAPAELTERVQFMAEARGEFALATEPREVQAGRTIRWNVRANQIVEVDPL